MIFIQLYELEISELSTHVSFGLRTLVKNTKGIVLHIDINDLTLKVLA